MIELLTGTSIQQAHSPTNQIAPQDSTDGLMHLLHIIGEFYAEGIDDHLMVALLLFVIIFDIILGVSCAWVYREYKSYKFRKGLVSHLSMFIVTALMYPLFVFAGLASGADSFIAAMVFAYGSSILANLARLGIHIPYIDEYVRNNIDTYKFEIKDSDTAEDIQRKRGNGKKKKKKKTK